MNLTQLGEMLDELEPIEWSDTQVIVYGDPVIDKNRTQLHGNPVDSVLPPGRVSWEEAPQGPQPRFPFTEIL